MAHIGADGVKNIRATIDEFDDAAVVVNGAVVDDGAAAIGGDDQLAGIAGGRADPVNGQAVRQVENRARIRQNTSAAEYLTAVGNDQKVARRTRIANAARVTRG